MKSKTKAGIHRFTLNLLHYGNTYYLERVAELERVLAGKPHRLQVDLIGEGEISAEWAMLIQELLLSRPSKSRLITNARSSLKNGSVLVWLLGDERRLAAHAQLFFRKATIAEEPEGATAQVWDAEELKYSDAETDPDEVAQARLLQRINEYLPVKDLAGKVVDATTLRQFGLVENEKLDSFLVTAFGQPTDRTQRSQPKPKPVRAKGKPASVPAQK